MRTAASRGSGVRFASGSRFAQASGNAVTPAHRRTTSAAAGPAGTRSRHTADVRAADINGSSHPVTDAGYGLRTPNGMSPIAATGGAPNFRGHRDLHLSVATYFC